MLNFPVVQKPKYNSTVKVFYLGIVVGTIYGARSAADNLP